MEKGQDTERNLKKDLGTIASMAIVIGMVIGSGIFMKPGKVIAAAGDSTMGLMAWALGGIITMAAGLTFAELGSMFPRTGGLYVYIDEIYGKTTSYLFGWVQTLIYGPATLGALGLYFGTLLASFMGMGDGTKVPMAVATVLFLAVVNSVGTKYGGWVQSLSTAGKLIPIVLIAVFGIIQGNGQVLGMPSQAKETAGMGMALLATLWAYDGWSSVAFVAGEMKNPAKVLPRAIIGGLVIVIAAYLSINIAMLRMLPAAEIVSLGQKSAGTVSGLLFGDLGGKMLSIGILVSIFGALNGNVLTQPRVPYAMACKGQLPFSGWLSQVHSSFGTPIYSTMLQVSLAILLMTAFDPDRLTDLAMFAIWIFYTLGIIGVIVARQKMPELPRSYRVPLYPLVPIVAIVGSLYILASTVISSPMDSIWSLVLTAAGVPVYWFFIRDKNQSEGSTVNKAQ